VSTTIPIRPGGHTAGLVRRVAGESGGVDDGAVAERDVGRRKGDPPGNDAGPLPQEDAAGEVGGDDAPGPLAGDRDAAEDYEAAVAADVHPAAQPHRFLDHALGVEVTHAAEVPGAGRRRSGRRRRQRGGRGRRVVVEREDRVRLRAVRLPPIETPRSRTRTPRCDGEEREEEEETGGGGREGECGMPWGGTHQRPSAAGWRYG
jgi:hypothetical protein